MIVTKGGVEPPRGEAERSARTNQDEKRIRRIAERASPYVIQPMSADDIIELFDPMLSLYRYLLLGELRPVSF